MIVFIYYYVKCDPLSKLCMYETRECDVTCQGETSQGKPVI